jgi:hypothetical protein
MFRYSVTIPFILFMDQEMSAFDLHMGAMELSVIHDDLVRTLGQ